ncbi:MAG: ribosome maturation factor RimM [Actinomycetota bacterium]|nr:ribosome maturation factor RimM [Actinomycetota bacterium]
MLVGKVQKAHGLKGQVSVEITSDDPSRFKQGSSFIAGSGSEATQLSITEVSMHQGRALVKFEGIDSREQADAIRGTLLFVTSDELRDQRDGEFWEHELVGMRVLTRDGVDIGVMTEVLSRTEQDLWKVTANGKEILLPASRAIIVEVDRGSRRIIVELPHGLDRT